MLAQTTDDFGEDLEAAFVLGMYHWCRYLALTPPDDGPEYEAAARFLEPVYRVDPQGVPDQLARSFANAAADEQVIGLFADHAADASPAELNDLASKLFEAYQDSGYLPFLNQVVSWLRDLVRTSAEDDPDRVEYLSKLGEALLTLAEQNDDVALFSEAVQVARQAVVVAFGNEDFHESCLRNLGVALRRSYARTGDTELLVERVHVARLIVAAVGERPDRAEGLSELTTALLALSEQNGDMTPLTEALEAGREAVAATADDDPELITRLINTGFALQSVFARTGDPALLTEAVEVYRRALAASRDYQSLHVLCLNNTSVALRSLYNQTDDLALLTEALQLSRQAVAATPPGHRDLAGSLSNCGSMLLQLFTRTGEAALLAEAVEMSRRAVEAAPEGHPDHGGCLSNLGLVLQELFIQTGDTAVLTEAVQVGRRALDALPEGHPDGAANLNNLGLALRMAFERTREVSWLVEAVAVRREAVRATPEGHVRYGAHSSNLGVALRALFELNGDTSLLTEAVHVLRQAVQATPEDHREFAGTMGNLGTALLLLSEQTADPATLAESLSCIRRASELTPEDDTERAERLVNAGLVLQRSARGSADKAALREAMDCFHGASQVLSAPPLIRVQALGQFAMLALVEPDRAKEALAAMEATVALLPQISPRTLARSDREHRVGTFIGLAEVAASAALAAGDPERAVELLEATRGRLVADTIDARSSDLARLHADQSSLAQEFEDLRERREVLERTEPGTVVSFGGQNQNADENQVAQDLTQARLQAQRDWDALLDRIRAVDGHSQFLAPPKIAELAAHANQGPIVYVFAGYALILSADPARRVRPVELKGLTRREALARAELLVSASRVASDGAESPTARRAAQQSIFDVLEWLWTTVAEPVLTALDHTTTPTDDELWPRVWWCPVGVLGYLPIHAAGHHRDVPGQDQGKATVARTVLDRVISSYIPTVRALRYARAQPEPSAPNDAALIVAVPDAPDTQILPGALAEADIIARLIPGAVRPGHPVRAEVLDLLPAHAVAHFSCHGVVDWDDAAASCLILHDHQDQPLTVGDINKLHMTGSLAYLSACDTATASPRLLDEAPHLSGAFHLAGYRNVVGTLWPVDDQAATRIVDDFYTRLTADGTRPPATELCAEALHHAVRRERARYPATPTYWAAHTHTGI
ncbi:MAG: CHAT domain-containing protein [Catenulispora sp.]|nr:CHAT domain-containing protein [Catenulispora sp.]